MIKYEFYAIFWHLVRVPVKLVVAVGKGMPVIGRVLLLAVVFGGEGVVVLGTGVLAVKLVVAVGKGVPVIGRVLLLAVVFGGEGVVEGRHRESQNQCLSFLG